MRHPLQIQCALCRQDARRERNRAAMRAKREPVVVESAEWIDARLKQLDAEAKQRRWRLS